MVVPQVRPRCAHREEAAAAAEEGGAPREVSEAGPRPAGAPLLSAAAHGPPRRPASVAGNLSFVGGGLAAPRAGGCGGPLDAPRSRPAPGRAPEPSPCRGALIDGGGRRGGEGPAPGSEVPAGPGCRRRRRRVRVPGLGAKTVATSEERLCGWRVELRAPWSQLLSSGKPAAYRPPKMFLKCSLTQILGERTGWITG